jgi:hypothetical protein
MDAAILIRDLESFRQVRPVWDRAAEMILIAADTGAPADVAEAQDADLGGRSFERPRSAIFRRS